MTIPKSLVWAIMVPFSVLSLYALWQVGYWGLFQYQFDHPAGWQVLTDLVVALTLVLFWIVKDARENQRSPWLWIGMTLALGSFGPLLYVVTSKRA